VAAWFLTLAAIGTIIPGSIHVFLPDGGAGVIAGIDLGPVRRLVRLMLNEALTPPFSALTPQAGRGRAPAERVRPPFSARARRREHGFAHGTAGGDHGDERQRALERGL
jgi:hypothetical protein